MGAAVTTINGPNAVLHMRAEVSDTPIYTRTHVHTNTVPHVRCPSVEPPVYVCMPIYIGTH
jgi:hypothetical protein